MTAELGKQSLAIQFVIFWSIVVLFHIFPLKRLLFLVLFSFFSYSINRIKTVDASMIRTRMVGIKGKHADHLTTTAAHTFNYCLLC